MALLTAGAITLSVVAAAAPGVGAATRQAVAPKPGGSVTYGLEAETGGGWCPASVRRRASSGIEVGAAIYDTLMVPNSKNEMVPYLAKSVTPNADYTQWKITLRDGIKFHDGTPLDAAAVVQELQRATARAH